MPKVICDVCGKGCKSYGELTKHQLVHSEIRSVAQCDICGLYFKDVAKHQARGHAMNLEPCGECGKQLSKIYMKKHLATVHAKAPSFACTYCPRKFTSKETLKAHVDIHQGVRYQCQFCPEHYGSYRNRHKHLRTKHTEEHANYLFAKNAPSGIGPRQRLNNI